MQFSGRGGIGEPCSMINTNKVFTYYFSFVGLRSTGSVNLKLTATSTAHCVQKYRRVWGEKRYELIFQDYRIWGNELLNNLDKFVKQLGC